MGREGQLPDEREFDASFGGHYPELRRCAEQRSAASRPLLSRVVKGSPTHVRGGQLTRRAVSDINPHGRKPPENEQREVRMQARIPVLASLAAVVIAATVAGPASGATGFDNERAAGYDINPKHQSNWEPTVAVDPNHPNHVYQLITGINAQACKGNCPGTSVLFRRSTDGGATFSPETFVCAAACKTIGWQFDPQIRVANDTNAGCGCGTIY